VPLAGATFTSPIRLDGSEIDQDTGPPDAVMVSVVGPSKLSTIVVGDTETVPGVTAGADEDDGAGWVGAGVGEGDGDLDAGAVGDGDGEPVADLVAAGDVEGLVVAGEVAWVPWLGCPVAPGPVGAGPTLGPRCPPEPGWRLAPGCPGPVLPGPPVAPGPPVPPVPPEPVVLVTVGVTPAAS
jgi:hypothetical protein